MVRDKPLIVGRQNDVDIILSHPERYVSKRHCEILLRGGRILIRDLHSTNGSFLGDTRLEPNQFYPWLPSQDIQLGPYTLSLVVEEQLNDGTMASAPEGTVNLDTYVRSRQLHVVCADGQPGRVPLALSPVVLGRLEDCDMTLANPRVSKRHLQVQRKGAVVEITDLRSTNGSFLDNRRLPANEPVIWRPGAVLRLGPYSVTLE